MPDAAWCAYAELFGAVLTLPAMIVEDGNPHPLDLGPEAAALFLSFEAELEPRLGEFGDLAPVADWAGKLAGAVARLAGLLHIAAHSARRPPWEDSPRLAASSRNPPTFTNRNASWS